MKFKTYLKESVEEPIITESFVQDELDNMYAPIERLIKSEKFKEAKVEIDALEADLNQFEQENSKKKIFKMPESFFESRRKELEDLRSKIPAQITESLDDMDKRCEKCNTLLNDGGTCPKCDDGEEDYEDKEDLEEDLSNREKLKRAFPELNFDNAPVTEAVVNEDSSIRAKLKAAYPELNFDEKPVTEGVEEATSNKEKLKRAYPELNFDLSESKEDRGINEKLKEAPKCVSEEFEEDEVYDEYDDDYSFDDVEEDRRHAALYGGDRTYCSCGRRFDYHDDGSKFCDVCDANESPDTDPFYDDNI